MHQNLALVQSALGLGMTYLYNAVTVFSKAPVEQHKNTAQNHCGTMQANNSKWQEH
jgi:hypothetical protein